MIYERIKSIILIILVSLSLYLTYQLWYGQKPIQLVVEEAYERVLLEKPRSLEEVITPDKIIMRTEHGWYQLQEGSSGFNLLWNYLSRQLQNIGPESLADRYEPLEGSRRLLTVYLNPALPAGQDLPWLNEAPRQMITEIELYALNNKRWLVMGSSIADYRTSILMPAEEADLLETKLAEIAAEQEYLYSALTKERVVGLTGREISVENVIYVPQDPVYMDTLLLRAEQIDRNLILKTFFVDHSLVRVIEEKDGGLIYTDGEKGLRITNFVLEYSHPRLEAGQTTISYPDALANSSNLISYHGGWPANLRLEKLSDTGQGRSVPYMAEWRMYHQGYPLYTGKPTRAIFNDRGLIHYTRKLLTVEDVILNNGERRAVAEWSRALPASIIIAEERLKIETAMELEMMELVYVIRKYANAFRGDPAWFIQLNGYKIILDGYSLDLLNEEDIL